MSRIDELIAEHCPNGVSYATVADVASYVRGVTYPKTSEETDGPIRILRSNNISLQSNTLNFNDVRTVSSSVRVRPDPWLRTDDILISAASGRVTSLGVV